jgi:hypothetical protein
VEYQEGGEGMSDEIKAATINARCTTALIRAMGMQAANSQFPQDQPYTEKDFQNVIVEEGTHWNAVASVLRDY